MLPDELLAQINAQFPCRETQIRQLSALYSQNLPSPPLLCAYGLTATGKTSIIKSYLSASRLPHAIINSRECITGRHLLERTISSCLDALDEYSEEEVDRRPYSRTESINTLVIILERMLEEWGRGKFVLVFDGIDKQREAPPTLLPALARFGELMPNLSILLISTLPLTYALHKPGVPHLHFPPYPRSSLLQILAINPPKIFLSPPSEAQFPDYTPDLAAEDDAWLWNRFLGAVYDSLNKNTGRDLVSFRNTATRLWRDFVKPIIDGQFGTRDFSRLMVNRRHLFQLEASVLDRLLSNPDPESVSEGGGVATTTTATASKKKKWGVDHDLPYYTTHLLISAYLSSYNPSRTDITYFMKHTDKRKNRRKNTAGGSKARHRRIPRHLLTPSPFPLDRLLAVFRSLLEGPVPQLADIYTQIATLTSMRLLVRTGGAGSADVLDSSSRWRVNYSWEYVRSLGRSVNLEVGEYLVGGVDV